MENTDKSKSTGKIRQVWMSEEEWRTVQEAARTFTGELNETISAAKVVRMACKLALSHPEALKELLKEAES